MSIRISHVHSQLTLLFDRPAIRSSRQQLEILGQKLASVDGVKSVRMQTSWYGSRQLTIDFDSELEPHTMLRKLASALRPASDRALSNGHAETPLATPAESNGFAPQTLPDTRSAPSVSAQSSPNGVLASTPTESSKERAGWRHLREFSYGVLAVGSLGMSWVGLLVPGIPTVPFVILTAHFALKASPALRQRLLRSKMFGPMMRDWHEHRAIHRSIQVEAYIFTVIIMVISFAVAPPNPALYAIMAFTGVFGLFLISRIPVIQLKEDDHTMNPRGQTAGFTPAVA